MSFLTSISGKPLQKYTQIYAEYRGPLAFGRIVPSNKTIAIDSFKVRAQKSQKNNYNQGRIDRHLDYIDNRIREYENALDQSDSEEEKAELAEKIKTQKVRKSKYKGLESQLKSTGKEQIRTTDKDAQSVVLPRHITQVGYNIQASVDAKNKLITHFDTGSVNYTNALTSVAIETKETRQVENGCIGR